MQSHQLRVVDEFAEMKGRTDKLRDFIMAQQQTEGGANVSPAEMKRLERQYMLMQDYASILRERIAADFK